MAIYNLNENFRINTDSLNWKVQERKINQDEESNNFNKEYWKTIDAGYCASPEKAGARIFEYCTMTSEEEMELREAIEFWESCRDEIIKSFQNFKESD